MRLLSLNKSVRREPHFLPKVKKVRGICKLHVVANKKTEPFFHGGIDKHSNIPVSQTGASFTSDYSKFTRLLSTMFLVLYAQVLSMPPLELIRRPGNRNPEIQSAFGGTAVQRYSLLSSK